jgi:hypothetical protein
MIFQMPNIRSMDPNFETLGGKIKMTSNFNGANCNLIKYLLIITIITKLSVVPDIFDCCCFFLRSNCHHVLFETLLYINFGFFFVCLSGSFPLS